MRQVAFLQSVVLAKGRRLRGSDLVAIGHAAGVAPLRTVLSTGNLIFDAEGDAAGLEPALEAALHDRLGKHIPVFVRRAGELAELIATNPFPQATGADPAHVSLRLMRRDPPPDVLARIADKTGPGERFCGHAPHALAVGPHAGQLGPVAGDGRALGRRGNVPRPLGPGKDRCRAGRLSG